jgi:hypothetical protein
MSEPGGSRAPASVSGRDALALAAGATTGIVCFAVLLGLGILLYERLWAGSLPALLVVSLFFGAVGLYAGWLQGVIVFSATRGAAPGDGGER